MPKSPVGPQTPLPNLAADGPGDYIGAAGLSASGFRTRHVCRSQPPAVAERPRGRAQEGGAGDEVVRAVHGDDTIHRGRRHCAKQAAHVPLAQRRPPLQDLGPEAPAGGLGLRRRQVEAEHPGGPEALQQPQHVVAAAAPRLQHHVPRRHARGLGNAVGERRCCLGVGHAVARPQAEVQPLGAPAAVQHATGLSSVYSLDQRSGGANSVEA
ncbi:unnamed protein product [Prorocentrum cordatum]|uniref:Uncharacterized protein n=1 Tax=Prorocentrum cordatum TaxID=2364126 RepID=A0ABN9QRA0_9DINO|nr:unnamed protein product [Polarella glacialis]